MYTPTNPIALCDTTGMSNEDWLKVREHGLGKTPSDKDYIPYTIGGSAVSQALGCNPWVSDEEFRDKKMGLKPVLETEFNEDAKAAGHIFEPFVAVNFLRWMHQNCKGVKVNLMKDMMRDLIPYFSDACPDKEAYESLTTTVSEAVAAYSPKWPLNPSWMYQCGIKDEKGNLKYPFALANIDGLVEVNGKMGIFEAKTTNPKSSAIWQYWTQGQVPPYYYWQVVYYMAIMNLDFCYITCCWGMTLGDMAVILVERNLEVEEELMEYLRQFVDDMEVGLPLDESKSDPELVTNWYYRLYGPATKSEQIELPSYCAKILGEATELEEEIAEAKKKLEALEKKRSSIVAELQPVMGEHSYATCEMEDGTKMGVKLKPSMKRAKFDNDTFKAEHPDLFEEYATVDATALGKAHADLKKKYTLPAEPNPKGSPSYELYTYDEAV